MIYHWLLIVLYLANHPAKSRKQRQPERIFSETERAVVEIALVAKNEPLLPVSPVLASLPGKCEVLPGKRPALPLIKVTPKNHTNNLQQILSL